MKSNKGELEGRVAFITGAAGAIGLALARGFAREGARLTLVDVREKKLKTVGDELKRTLGEEKILSLRVDVRKGPSVRKAFDATLKKFGRLDILINNAAVTQIKPVDEITDEDIDLVIDTNLKGYIKCAREAAKIMKSKRIRGVLLFISSKNGLTGASEKCLYSASKGGELTLARALAQELGAFGIRVNSLCPDAVLEGSSLWEDKNYREGTCRRYNITEDQIEEYYSKRSALKVNIKPEDVAEAALFLVSERSSRITGSILSVDGGVAFVR